MYCKFCGNPIDRASLKCTACGKPVGSLSGGNSFRDVLEGKTGDGSMMPGEYSGENARIQMNQIDNAIRDVKKSVLSKIHDLTRTSMALCILAGVICIAVVLVSGAISAHKVSALKEEVFTLSEKNVVQLQTISNDVDLIKNALQTGEGDSEKTPIYIEKSPESETIMTPEQASLLLVCRAGGADLHFSWMKYNAEKNLWEYLDNSNLYIIENEANESRLTAVAASRVHEGTYICVVQGRNGQMLYSAPAQLSIDSSMTNNGDGSIGAHDEKPDAAQTEDGGSQS